MDDHELRSLFAAEVAERSERMIGVAQLMANGTANEEDRDLLRREAHTVKGTGRMMGFAAIGRAGALVEEIAAEVAAGKREADPGLARAIEAVGRTLTDAIDGDPEGGTPELNAALESLNRAVMGLEEVAAPEPPPPDRAEEADAPAVEPPEDRLPQAVAAMPADILSGADSSDLGGLLVALDSWAFGETVRVNAVSLFQMINGICSLRVDTEALDTLVQEAAEASSSDYAGDDLLNRLRAAVARAEQAADDLQRQALDLAAAPVSEITNTYPQLIRYLARKSGKEIRFELVGDEHAADRQVLERLSDPIRQLLVNAIHHGVETTEERLAAGKSRTGLVALRIQVKDNKLEVVIEDDGRGIDWAGVHRAAVAQGLLGEDEAADLDRLRGLLFTAGFSTSVPGEIVGDGTGLASAAEAVEALHGTLMLETNPQTGTRITLVVPTSRALQDAVLIQAAGHKWGIPEIAVLDRLPVDAAEFHGGEADREMSWRGSRIPVRSFAEAAGLAESDEPGRVLVVSSPTGPLGFTVAREIGARQVAARELGPLLDGVPHLTGAALLGGGDVVVLVDPARLAERAMGSSVTESSQLRVLVIDDSLGARQVVGGALGSAGFEVSLAGSAAEALDLIAETHFDAIVSDYVLPSMDGASLVGEIRGRGVDSPIVVLSGLATPHDQSLALEAGADLYFDKDDVRRGALAEALRNLIGKRDSND